MSSDTAKENASVVDSSVTEKHEIGDEPESSSYKLYEDGYPSRAAEAEAGHSDGQFEKSTQNQKGRPYDTRYFIIKSLNHQNIQLSVEKGIWATQVMNEPILEEAFQNSSKVILIFSVNMSGFFQGYAQMMSSVGWRRDNVWSRGSGKGNPWGRSFKVKWLQLNDLPFQKTFHLKNPLNDNKPVKISRDCQELPQDIGEALCNLLDGKGDGDGMTKSFVRDDLSAKGPCAEPPCSLGYEGYHMPELQMQFSGATMSYPPFFYPNLAGASNFHLSQGSAAVAENFPIASVSPKPTKIKRSQIDGSLSNLQVDHDMSSRRDFCGLPAESPLASTITEDDFLEMSYEEYLEAHSRSIKQLCNPVTGPAWMMNDLSSRKQENDSNSSLHTGNSWSRKRSHHSSQNDCVPTASKRLGLGNGSGAIL